jgi:hypothetical protein
VSIIIEKERIRFREGCNLQKVNRVSISHPENEYYIPLTTDG